MSSFLLLQQCSACLVRLIWMVFEMGGRWPYSCCFVGCCFQDSFNIARSVFVQFLSSFFSILCQHQVVHPYSSMDTTAAWKKWYFILSDRSDFHMTDNLSIPVHAFASHILMLFSVDETLLLRQMNLFTIFRESPFSVEMWPLLLQHMYSVLSAFTWRSKQPATRSRLCSRDSAQAGIFARSAMSSLQSTSSSSSCSDTTDDPDSLSFHLSQSSITPGRSSKPHPAFAQS